jgi:hypothetical protein
MAKTLIFGRIDGFTQKVIVLLGLQNLPTPTWKRSKILSTPLPMTGTDKLSLKLSYL